MIESERADRFLVVQQNVEIPEIVLNIHPVIQAAITAAQEQGIQPSVESTNPALLTDSTFLNRLQADVNNWVKEIRTVTNLNRDVSSGTASQEINFWLSMERALDGIEEQLKSDSVGEDFSFQFRGDGSNSIDSVESRHS